MARLQDSDLPEWLKRWVRIRRDGQEYFGQLVSRSDAIVATSVATPARPWILRTQDADIHFLPEDNWEIEFVRDDAV
jgi:hypothetical protein